MPVPRRAVLLGLLALAGCDDEPAQRKAFMTFLQTRILDRPGIHVPRMTDADRQAFGPYAGQYDIITDYQAGLDTHVSKPMQEAVRHGTLTSLSDLVARRGDLQAIRTGMAALSAALDEEFARADGRRAGLKQPADLKPVFDAAFERVVAAPNRGFKEALPTADAAMGAMLDLAAFLDGHRDRIKVDGIMAQVSDPALQRELQGKMDTVRARGEATMAAQRKLQAMISGG